MDTLKASLTGTIYIVLIALPGYFVAVALIDIMGRWKLQLSGFLATSLAFAVLAAAYYTPLRTGANGAGFVIIYGLTYFFSNAGPNTTVR